MSEKLLGRYEMLWDCSFCGTQRLLAVSHRHCPECGAPQDQTKRYFPKDDEKVAIADDYAGTDRACPNCKHANGAKATFCAQCGAPLDEAAAVKKRSDQVVKAGQQFAADDAVKAEAELGDRPRPAPPAKKKSWTWLYVLIVLAAAIFAIWFMCIRKRAADLEVAEQRWERAIAVEEYKEVSEEAWRHELPSGARVRSCRDKEYESKQVPDGEDCNVRRVDQGDGTFVEKQECTPRYRREPVYREWCSYTVLRWERVDERVARGTGDGERAWPETNLPAQVAAELGARREGARQERFVVDLVEGKRTHTCAIDEAVWKQLPRGAAAYGEVRARSGEIVCSTVKPK